MQGWVILLLLVHRLGPQFTRLSEHLLAPEPRGGGVLDIHQACCAWRESASRSRGQKQMGDPCLIIPTRLGTSGPLPHRSPGLGAPNPEQTVGICAGWKGVEILCFRWVFPGLLRRTPALPVDFPEEEGSVLCLCPLSLPPHTRPPGAQPTATVSPDTSKLPVRSAGQGQAPACPCFRRGQPPGEIPWQMGPPHC